MLLLGLLLAVVLYPVSGSKKDEEEEASVHTQLEERLAAILSGVEGVGEVQVMLMTREDKGSGSFSGAQTEQKVTGVLISAAGADNSVVVQKIQEAVMALFQVEAHKIKVMKKI